MRFRRFGGSDGSGGVGGYCYVFYDYERGVAVERRCGFKCASDALAALEGRVGELAAGGARCEVLGGEVGAGGTPVYLCEAPGCCGGVARLVGRVDVETVDSELAARRRAEKLAAIFVLWWVLFALLAIIVTLLG